ncbi:MAG TPA: branched-chain amino acid ABC transporter permease [Candidatus Dormibacteraeota bacterium]|nr:branched-chain amino acid ABC transporter permease [Candidatus Dormibacteraeota bacterium]
MGQQLLNAIFLGSIYALFAVGYTLVFGVLDVLNLAHSAVFMLGAVVAYSIVGLHGGPFWLGMLAALTVSAGMGLVIEFVALRPLRRRGAPPLSALIATIGLALIIVALIEQSHAGGWLGWLWQDGANPVRFPPGSVPNPILHVAGLIIPGDDIAIGIVTVALMLILGWIVRATSVGRALRAVAENQRASRLMGIDVDRLFALTLVGSSALAGLAGVLFGLALSDIDPYIGRDQVELRGLAIIVLGGMGSVTGAVVGGYLLAIIEVAVIVAGYTNLRAGVAFAALFLMLVLRPQGLFGSRVQERL